jgi:uncharacterized circularly permuted ATP-grasp superfamily protein
MRPAALAAARRTAQPLSGEASDMPRAIFEEAAAELAAIAERGPAEARAAVREWLQERGVSFTAVNGDAEFLLDPVPRVIAAGEWAALERGLAQRVIALNRFLADAYGAREIVAEGVVEARVIETAPNHEPRMRGVRVPGGVWAGVAGLDIVRDPSGRFLVLEDNLTTPSGFGYAVAARDAVLAALAPAQRPRPVAPAAELLAGALRAVAPVERPAAVVLTDGPGNSAHWEHAWAAERLGLPLVEPTDLRVRGRRLYRGRDPVDVVYRRSSQDRIDTDVGRLLYPPLAAGTLGLVNAFGTGAADDKLAHAYVEDMIRFYLREEPLLPSVPTYDLAREEQRERALDEAAELVFKPRGGSGGLDVVIGPHADRADIEAVRARVREDPGAYVAQPMVMLSRHPTVIDGALAPRHVDLRPFVFLHGPDDARVLPGGLSRVALDEGALVVNSTQNGGVKDTWVVD